MKNLFIDTGEFMQQEVRDSFTYSWHEHYNHATIVQKSNHTKGKLRQVSNLANNLYTSIWYNKKPCYIVVNVHTVWLGMCNENKRRLICNHHAEKPASKQFLEKIPRHKTKGSFIPDGLEHKGLGPVLI